VHPVSVSREPVDVAPPLPGAPSHQYRPGNLQDQAEKSRFLDDFPASTQNRSLLVVVAVLVLAGASLEFIVGFCILPVGRRKKPSDIETLLSDSLHSDPDILPREYTKRSSNGPSGYGVPEIPGPGRAFMSV
jgi:hypothetical protein